MCKTCTNLTHTNLETVHSIHFELWAFVVKVRDIDCLNVEIKLKSACNFHIIQRMDVKFDTVNVRDLLHVFHPNVAI